MSRCHVLNVSPHSFPVQAQTLVSCPPGYRDSLPHRSYQPQPCSLWPILSRQCSFFWWKHFNGASLFLGSDVNSPVWTQGPLCLNLVSQWPWVTHDVLGHLPDLSAMALTAHPHLGRCPSLAAFSAWLTLRPLGDAGQMWFRYPPLWGTFP